jgi:hypothetical protein
VRAISTSGPTTNRPPRSLPFSPVPTAVRRAAFAPLISNNLGVKKVPIGYTINGKIRAAQIPGVLNMGVEPLPTMHPSGEIWAAIGHPVAPDKLAPAVGSSGSTFGDHGMHWDNSGRNGHYAPISWSN